MKPDKLRALINGDPDSPFLTVQQQRRVRKRLAKQKVEVVLTMTGGEFLELDDARQRAGLENFELWLMDWVRECWRSQHRRRLGFAYDVHDDDLGPPPRVSKRLRRKLGLSSA